MATVVGFDETKKPRITCRGCGAINEYVKNEVETWSGIDYSGGSSGQDFIVCGNCGDDVVIKSW